MAAGFEDGAQPTRGACFQVRVGMPQGSPHLFHLEHLARGV